MAWCTLYHAGVYILVNEFGEVAVCQLLDPAPNVAELEHQQLCTLLQFLIPSSVSRLGGLYKNCEVGGWDKRRKKKKQKEQLILVKRD